MSMYLKYVKLMGVIFPLVLFACGNETEVQKQKEETEHEHHEDELADKVVLSNEQIKTMGIQTEKVAFQNISGYVRVNGEVVINPDQESKVGSIIPGRVNKIFVKEGSYVRKGQTLALIENLDLVSAQVEYLEAKHEYQHAKLEYERQLRLASENIGSNKELMRLKVQYEHAVIGMKSAEQKLQNYKISKSRLENYEDPETANELQRYYPIVSPISGNVVKRNVTVGQFIESSVDIFHIVNISTVYVDLNVFEKDLQYVSVGQKAALEVSVSPYEVYEGKITYIDKVFDDEKRTVKVRIAVSNKREKLLPFMFVSAKIYVNEERVLAVPLSALETEGESKFIFVKRDEKREVHEEHETGVSQNDENGREFGVIFQKVLVNTGISDDKYVQIFPVDELKQGDEVVTKGTFYLKSELKKEELGEHEH
jgi:cobalt-zinc-cadmium efflux system membrane fusion protein